MASFSFILCVTVVLAGICLGQDSPTSEEVQELTTQLADIKEEVAEILLVMQDLTAAINFENDQKQEKKDAKKAKKAAKRGGFADCAALQNAGYSDNGVYTIFPQPQNGVEAYCDFTTDGGGWTVFQARLDGSVDFFVYWDDYELGFGDPAGENWLGLANMRSLVELGFQALRIDMEDWDGTTGFAKYSVFSIGPADENYKLTVSGFVDGNQGNAFQDESGRGFTTRDRDNDGSSVSNCAERNHGAWWFRDCYTGSHLNGAYRGSLHTDWGGVDWLQFNRKHHLSLKTTRMMMRPATFYPAE